MRRPGSRVVRAAVLLWMFAPPTLVSMPGVALAHSAGQPIPDAAYYRAELRDIASVPAGVQVRVDPAGEWIELTNTGPAEVIILGYAREPYLRVTGTTVQQNELSQTTYLNQTLFADSVPTGQDPGAVAPAWQTIGENGSVRWHDHRIHWMGQARPPAVAADPRHPHQVGDWTVHATAAGQPFEIHGDLRWLGKPDVADGQQTIPQWLLWLLESMAVVIALLIGLVMHQRRRDQRRRVDPAAPAPVPVGSTPTGPPPDHPR